MNELRQYIKADTILPLNEAYGSGSDKVQTDALPPSVVEAFTYEGKKYAVPANFATLLLYYNKDMFAEAGIQAPPKTMDEFRDIAVKLTKVEYPSWVLMLHNV